MTKIKLCGLSRRCDIDAANELNPEYIGFVFDRNSKRYVSSDKAEQLKKMILPDIHAVGVFVDEPVDTVAELLRKNIIDIVQLHGNEDEDYIKRLRKLTDKPIIKAFCIETARDVAEAEHCAADYVLLDSGTGTGTVFDWKLIQNIKRPYFLAGGLSSDNVEDAVKILHPFAVDVSSGIETDGVKNKTKMTAFVAAVRKEDKL